MSLYQQIQSDMKDAMRAKQMLAVTTLRMLISELKKKAIEQKADRNEIEDALVQKTIGTLVKQRRDSAQAFKQGERHDLAEKEEQEIAVLTKYLPEQLSRSELEAIVQSAIETTSASSPKDMGKVMKVVLEKVAGQAEGKLVSEIVRSKLANA